MTDIQTNKQFHDVAKERQPFEVYHLQKGDLSDFFALQTKTNTRPKTGHYLKPRTLQEIEQQLEAGNTVLGIKDKNGVHIAQCIVANPNISETENIQAFEGEKSYLTIQSVAFAEGFRPKQLASWDSAAKPDNLLFEEAKKIATKNNVATLLAKVNSANKGSVTMFERTGFTANSPQTVGNDNYQSCVMHFNVAVAQVAEPIADAPEHNVRYPSPFSVAELNV